MKLILILAVIFSLLPVNVYAWCGCNNGYPPQLDEQQGTRWVNALPTARPYLARLWEVPQQVAEFYGAKYKMLACGSGFYTSDIQSGFGNSNDSNDRWNLED
jgi:hypothetical protein